MFCRNPRVSQKASKLEKGQLGGDRIGNGTQGMSVDDRSPSSPKAKPTECQECRAEKGQARRFRQVGGGDFTTQRVAQSGVAGAAEIGAAGGVMLNGALSVIIKPKRVVDIQRQRGGTEEAANGREGREDPTPQRVVGNHAARVILNPQRVVGGVVRDAQIIDLGGEKGTFYFSLNNGMRADAPFERASQPTPCTK